MGAVLGLLVTIGFIALFTSVLVGIPYWICKGGCYCKFTGRSGFVNRVTNPNCPQHGYPTPTGRHRR
jgi:hypothetical protein